MMEAQTTTYRTYEHNGVTYPEYCFPSNQDLEISLQTFLNLFELFCQQMKLNVHDFQVDLGILTKIFVRVDQRKLHYKMYHNMKEINELKEAATYAYWLVKLKPIVNFAHGFLSTGKYNEMFAVYLSLSVIKHYRQVQGLQSVNLKGKVIDDFMYTLLYRNCSYDSLTILLEAIAL